MNIKIEQLKKRLDSLEKFLDTKKCFQKSDLICWISGCVSLFVEIGVSEEIINKFMKTFEFEEGLGNISIGPFCFSYGSGDSGYSYINSDIQDNLSRDIYYVNIAFTAAKAILQREQDEERLIPKFLITTISENGKYSNIFSSLELLERFYQEKNSDGLFKESATLLSSVLSLSPELKDKKDLGPMLMCLIDNEDVRKKFGIDPDFARALNNSRLIRNFKSVHKELPIKYDISFLVSLSCAYLVILFLEITISVGEIIK